MKRFLAILLSALMVFSAISVMAAAAENTATMAVSYAGNGTFNIAGTLPADDGDYNLIVAQYDAAGKMLDVSTQPVVAEAGIFTTTAELSYAPTQTKFMLWEMGEATPCADVVALPDEGGYNLITTKTEVGTSTGKELSANPLMNLVDGDDSTCAMIYGNAGSQGAMYVDLEAAYEIDRVEVLSYHNFFNRGSGFDVVLGNTVPDNIAYEEDAGEFKAGHLAEDLNATSTAVGYKTFYVPADAGAYRYVSLETFDETDGISVAEIKVYVKNAPEAIEYVSVTDKATTHKSSSTATAITYETDPNNYLVDGNDSIPYGTGPAPDAYFTFIDLGYGGRRVDKVVITSNDTHNPDRVKGQKYYLANTLPINGADRSEWVHLGTRINNAVPMTFILSEEQAGMYRYVVADCTDAAVGGYVNEIEVYKDATYVEPVFAQNVARGKSVTYSHAPTIAGCTDPTVITNGVFWATRNEQFIITTRPSAVYIDLEERYSISKVVIDAVTKDFTKDIEVYISDTPSSGTVIPGSATKILEGNSAGWDSSVKTIDLDTAVDGRYVIVKMTSQNSASFRLNEVEAWGLPSTNTDVEVEASNVAYGKANVDSVVHSMNATGGYEDVSVVTDGSICVGGNSKQFIGSYHGAFCLDLGANYDIEKVMIDAVATGFSSNLSVYLADEPYSTSSGMPANKTPILEGTDEWGVATKTIELETPVNARYIIVLRSAGGVFRLGELEVWGK